MSDKTSIEWADATWPVVTGCTHISAGCDHCYAAKLTGGRLRHLPAYAGLAEHGKFNGTVRLLPERLDWPLHWRKPRKVFVSDMADLFHESVPDGFIGSVFDVMAQTPQHTYQILTKRHGRMRALLSRWNCAGGMWRRDDGLWCGPIRGPLPNVWVGVSAEDPHWAEIRIPALLATPAAVRFVSAEPLLGPITLFPGKWIPPLGGGPRVNLRRPHEEPGPALDWVIIGSEEAGNG